MQEAESRVARVSYDLGDNLFPTLPFPYSLACRTKGRKLSSGHVKETLLLLYLTLYAPLGNRRARTLHGPECVHAGHSACVTRVTSRRNIRDDNADIVSTTILTVQQYTILKKSSDVSILWLVCLSFALHIVF